MRQGFGTLTVLSSVAVSLSCGGPAPTEPTQPEAGEIRLVVLGDTAALSASNLPPELDLRTQPEAVPGSPHPVISGRAPLTVKFNLCRSSDPDRDPTTGESDTLNWQFHFGDDGSEAFDADGTFNANVGQQCRTEHTYQDGRYVATVSVTDRHLEDQAREVSALARRTQRVTIEANQFSDAPALLALQTGIAIFSLVGGPGTGGFPGAMTPAVSETIAQAASRIVVTVELTANTYSSFRVGVADAAGGVYLAGAPSLTGTGTFSYELTPGQFAGAGSLNGVSFSLGNSAAATVASVTVQYFG